MRKSWPWWLLAAYAGLSLLDYGLTTTALRIGRMGLSSAAGGSYEGNPVAAWLFLHDGTVSVLVYKVLTVVVGALLLLVIRPMWTVLGAGVLWQLVGVCSVMYVFVSA